MADLRFIAIHHAGGLGTDNYASTKALTVGHIDNAHKDRWNFPSQYMKAPSGKPWYFGYSVIYDPKDRTFTQGRALGEETAAQLDYNFDTFSICIIGNFTKTPIGSPAGTVDPMTQQIQDDITKYLHDLMGGNKRGLVVVPGTGLDFDISRVHPHRWYNPGHTECYGTGLDDNLFRDLLIQYKPAPFPGPAPQPTQLVDRGVLEQILMQLFAVLSDLLRVLQPQPAPVGGRRSCDGIISI